MPFLTQDQKYDFSAVQKQVERYTGAGVSGLFVLTTCGQSMNFSFEENRDLADVVLEAAQGRTPVYVGIGRTKEEPGYPFQMLQQAIDKKADAAVVLCSDMAPEEQVEHFRRLDEYKFPLIAYSLGTQQKQVKKVGEILVMESVVGMKLTVDVRQPAAKEYFKQAVGSKKPVFMGEDVVLYEGLELGASGGVNAIANLIPDVVVELYQRYGRGDNAGAQQIQEKINQHLLSALYYNVDSAGKPIDAASALQNAMWQLFGYGSPVMRSPKPTYSGQDQERIQESLHNFAIFAINIGAGRDHPTSPT